ncbi:uncharacterized protein F4822DRAFT_428507 [Hypoxylon trugodes]|uniref:uncharacterized protein n=1 Tax=Hypoxylon trugodes TaxID=326681 RepID=UPI002193976C|nr:uncharacterized protein F4822DRAFT_428507 [Hypoxylon trugodes]KAI1390164.1 hypothetical protein F4822DRAFT_428507 [Hypoxylon trugodes]
MPPITRLQSRRQRQEAEGEMEVEDSGSESDAEPDFEIDDEGLMVSPSNLEYSLDLLDEEARDNITRAIEVPSQFVLRGCQAGDQRCLFLITEPIEYTVRTGTDESGYGVPSCTCQSGERGESPCRHILWLCDQITSQVLGIQRDPFTLSRYGYPTELGNPYDAISDFHLDMLADSLHCDVVGQSPDLNPRRVRESREMLASLSEVPVDEYRPDLFNNPKKSRRVIKRGDLEQTIFHMLLYNDDFFQYFLSSMRAEERNKDRFRSLRHRADAALAGLHQYAANPSLQNVARPKNVEWCATHLISITRQIYSTIHNTGRQLEDWELEAAAQTSIHVLEQVANYNRDFGPPELPKERQNLFHRLIGNQDQNFVIDILSSIPPQVLGSWGVELTTVLEKISEQEVPVSYTMRLSSLVSHLRSRGAPAGSKRTRQGKDRRAKRVK